MSVILDVLRKLDREKSPRRSAAADIALEILKPEPPRLKKRGSLYFTAIGLTAIATAAITYTLMGFGFLSKSPAPGPMGPPPAGREIAQVPLHPAPPTKSSLPPVKSPPASSQMITPALPQLDQPKSTAASRQKATLAPLPLESGRGKHKETSRVPLEIRTPADKKPTTVSPGEKEANRKVIPAKAEIAPQKAEKVIESTPTPPQQIPERPAVALPSLKISAIIWYDEPAKRFAMINDKLTYEGSVIDAVKVVEIYPNRVRFLHNGRHFEISVR